MDPRNPRSSSLLSKCLRCASDLSYLLLDLVQAEPQIAMEIKRWEQKFRYLSVLDHVSPKNVFNFQIFKFQKEHFFNVRPFAGMCAGVRKSALVVRTLLWAPNPQKSTNSFKISINYISATELTTWACISQAAGIVELQTSLLTLLGSRPSSPA